MLDPAQLAALAAVHRRGSFDLAAGELGVTPSAVSQRIRALEETVGTLLVRRGQPCHATAAGLRLVRHHDELALMERRLAAELPGLDPGRAVIRVAVNADSLATWVLPALAALPDTLFDLVIDDQDVSQDWLRRGEVVAAITGHPGPLQGCETLALGALRYRATASPAFRTRWFAGGITRAALAQAPTISFSEQDRLQQDWAARQLGVAGGRQLPPLPCHRLASSQGFVEACRLGMGWAMNPDVLTAPLLARGELEELVAGTPLDVPLYWQFTRLVAPALAPLTQAIRHAARAVLIPPAATGR